MKTRDIIIIIVLILLIGFGAWVLLGGKKAIAPGEEPVIKEESTLSLTEIFGKAKEISSLKYNMVVTAPGEIAETVKMWRKGNKMRMEGSFEGQSIIYLMDVDNQLAYMYFSAENTAMEISLGEVQESVGESPTEQSESVMRYNPTTLGTEILDGKSCLVIKYTTATEEVKMWTWTKYGLSIKTESTTDEGTSIIELKNIDLSAIPDSMFELPAGAQIMDIPFAL